MRYYHPFPEAIPLSEAGCSRVTHPSATMLSEQAPITPFDLHVLGVPPAFVLSQDQTLHRVVSPNRVSRLWNLSHCESLAITVVFYSLVWLLNIDSFGIRINKGSSFSCLFLSRIVQFSRCRFCRFWKFLPRQATYLLYHIFGSLSSLFSNFFQNFFSILWLFRTARPLHLSISLQAFLLYHISRSLSRGFSDFFKSFSRPDLVACPPPSSATPVRLGSELIYYTTFQTVCQEVFSKFLKFS